MTEVKCSNYRCKFNKDSVCQKDSIEISYYFEEMDDCGFDSYSCESEEN